MPTNEDKMPKEGTSPFSFDELNSFYDTAETVDKEVFAEMRSNVLLVNGEHYTGKIHKGFNRIRTSRNLSEKAKLRLTKNHIQHIQKIYANEITSANPGVGFRPANESELQDQKTAELNHSVWRDAVRRYSVDEKVDDWADDFTTIGEVATKIFYEKEGGDIIGFRPKMTEDGEPEVDENGNMVPDKDKPVRSGKFNFEDIYGFNLLRSGSIKDIRKSPYLVTRKMVNKKELMKKFPGNKDLIQGDQDETFKIFDPTHGGFRDSKEETLVREFYFRPSPLMPNGYFYITTKLGILAEGELPGGIFPIVMERLDKVQTTPRGKSIVKDMRPYQVEINRSASKIAEHQITLGDDKLIIQNGTKVSAGTSLPGVRTVNVSGAEPTILQGRDGSQYLNYMNSQIEEMYFVMGVQEMRQEKQTGNIDAFALLFQSANRKKKFRRYLKRFERFLISVADTYLQLAKVHLPDGSLIRAVGRDEFINLEEFRNMDDFRSQIVIEAQAEDIESKLGKQLVLTQTLQYASGQLEKEDIGKIIRNMPFVNSEEMFDDITMDYDTATNVILALDRGERPDISPFENHIYMIKRLVGRMRKADFKFLPPEVQQGYGLRLQLHEQMEAENQRKIQAMNDQLIPTGGYLVTMDFYMSDPKDPTKTKRARLPYESILWLIQRLESQGQGLDRLEEMNRGALAQLSQQLLQKQTGGVTTGIEAPQAAQGGTANAQPAIPGTGT